jgi:hypothetical protein
VAALAANTSRRWALFINDSSVVMYLMVGATAVANQGIRLQPGGGAFELSPNNGNLDLSAVNVIAASGSGNVLLVATAN